MSFISDHSGILLLIVSILVLFVGPALSYLLMHLKAQKVLDAINILTVLVIIIMLAVHVLPELWHIIGWWCLLCLGIGFFLPLFIENMVHKLSREVHIVTMILAITGWVLHTALDGAALSPHLDVGHDHGHNHGHANGHDLMLPLLVVLHRIPVGQLIWFLVRPQLGIAFALGMIGFLILGTVSGYFIANSFMHIFHTNSFAIFQSVVAGSLLHVIMFNHHIKHQH